MRNIAFARSLRRFLEQPKDQDAALIIEQWLGSYVAGGQYESVFLLDERGSTMMAIPAAGKRIAGVSELRATDIRESREPVLHDFHLDSRGERILLSAMVPILDPERNDRVLGILAFRIDPHAYLYPFIGAWPVPSRTAETLLVRKEGNEALFLNDLRFHPDAALRLRIPMDQTRVPAVMGASGHEGVVEGIDYRGERVIASIKPVPGSPWVVIAKMDAGEAFEPLRERMWIVIITVTGLLAAGGVGFFVLQRNRELRFYRDREKTVTTLQETTAFLENLLAGATSPILVWDRNLRIIRFNRAFESLSGRSVVWPCFGIPPPDGAAKPWRWTSSPRTERSAAFSGTSLPSTRLKGTSPSQASPRGTTSRSARKRRRGWGSSWKSFADGRRS
jgi:PAS domain-containing protein